MSEDTSCAGLSMSGRTATGEGGAGVMVSSERGRKDCMCGKYTVGEKAD